MKQKKLDEIIANVKGRSDIFNFIWALYRNKIIKDRDSYIEFLANEGYRLSHLRAFRAGEFSPNNFDWTKMEARTNSPSTPNTPKPPKILVTVPPRQKPVDDICKIFLSFSTNKVPKNHNEIFSTMTVEDLSKYTYAPEGIFELRIDKDTFPTFLKEAYRLKSIANPRWKSAFRIFNARVLFFDVDYLSKFDEKQENVKNFGNSGFIHNLLDEFEGFLKVGYDDQSQNPNPKHSFSFHLFAWCTGDETKLLEKSRMSAHNGKSGVDIFQTTSNHLVHLKPGKKVFDGPLKEIDSDYIHELQTALVQRKQNKWKNFFKDDSGNYTRLKGVEEWSLFGTKRFLPENTISRLLEDNERFVKIETPVRSGKTTMVIHTIVEFAKKPKERNEKLLYIVKNKISRDEVHTHLLEAGINFTRIVAKGEEYNEKNTQCFEEFVNDPQDKSVLLMSHSMFGKNFTNFQPYINNPNNFLIIDEGHFGVKVNETRSFLEVYKVENLQNLASTFILSGNKTMNNPEDEKTVNDCFLRYNTNIELEDIIKFTTFKCKSINDFANYCLENPQESIDILLNYSKIDLFAAWKKTADQHPNKKIGFCWSGDVGGVRMFNSIRTPIKFLYDFIYTTSIVAGFSLLFPGENAKDFEKRMRNKVVRIGIEGPEHMNQAFINDIMQLIGRFQPHWGIKIEIFFVSRKGTKVFPTNLLVPELFTRFKNFETDEIVYTKPEKKEETLIFEEKLARMHKRFQLEYTAKPEEFEFFKRENEFDLGNELNVVDFGSVWSDEHRAEIERLNGLKRQIRKVFTLYKKDKTLHGKMIRTMKDNLNKLEQNKTKLIFESRDTRDECIAKVEEFIGGYIDQNIKNLRLLLNAFKDLKVIGIDKLPTVVKRRLQKPQTIVKDSVYWTLLSSGEFRAKGNIEFVQTEECLKGSESFEFLRTFALDADIMDNIVFENRRATIMKKISYFKTKTAKKTSKKKEVMSYFKEHCMQMKPDDAVEFMKKEFPTYKMPNDKFKVWRNRLK